MAGNTIDTSNITQSAGEGTSWAVTQLEDLLDAIAAAVTYDPKAKTGGLTDTKNPYYAKGEPGSIKIGKNVIDPKDATGTLFVNDAMSKLENLVASLAEGAASNNRMAKQTAQVMKP